MNYQKKIVVFLFFLTFFILFLCISLWRFNTAQVFYYDFGIFARSLWQIAHGLNPQIYHKTLGEIHFLGDHFSPSLYILAPLFWITNSLQILLIEQALSLAVSGYLIYLIAQSEKLSIYSSLIVSFVFFTFAGMVNPLVTDWHTEPTAALFLLLFIYLFFYRKKYREGTVLVFLFLGLKESNAISFLLCLIPFFIIKKKERYKIFILGGIALMWFFLSTLVVMPFFTKQSYYYAPELPHYPLEWIAQFFNLPQKRLLITHSFISFGFLPLMSVPFLIPIIGELGIRLLPIQSHFQSYTLGMHYNVFLGIFLVLGTIHILSLCLNKQLRIFLTIYLLIISIIVAKKITRSPIILATNTIFWKEWNKKAALFKELTCVPHTGSIMSQNNILPHLIQRKEKIYLLSQEYETMKPDYIVMDLSSGQNLNNFYSGEINNYTQVLALKKNIEHDSQYERMKSPCKYLFLFKRK